MADQAQAQLVSLALGRILRMASRPTQDGDLAQYERCRGVILNALDPEMTIHHAVMASQPDIGRDRWKGAQGQW
jgi:hypothetical protein